MAEKERHLKKYPDFLSEHLIAHGVVFLSIGLAINFITTFLGWNFDEIVRASFSKVGAIMDMHFITGIGCCTNFCILSYYCLKKDLYINFSTIVFNISFIYINLYFAAGSLSFSSSIFETATLFAITWTLLLMNTIIWAASKDETFVRATASFFLRWHLFFQFLFGLFAAFSGDFSRIALTVMMIVSYLALLEYMQTKKIEPLN